MVSQLLIGVVIIGKWKHPVSRRISLDSRKIIMCMILCIVHTILVKPICLSTPLPDLLPLTMHIMHKVETKQYLIQSFIHTQQQSRNFIVDIQHLIPYSQGRLHQVGSGGARAEF